MAMFRKELGWIGFEWGKPGTEPPEFDSHEEFRQWQKTGRKPYDEGGHGISHIIAKRDWEGKYIKQFHGQSGQDIAFKVVEIVARGEIYGLGKSAIHATIKWNGYEVGLNRKSTGGGIYWVITGYEKPTSGYTYEALKTSSKGVIESAGERSSFNDLTLRLRKPGLQLSVQAWERQTQASKRLALLEQEVNPGWLYDL